MRLALPSPAEAALAAALAGAVQLAVACVFRARRARARPLPESPPPATLVIPCAGSLAGLGACLESFLDQDYRGTLELLFVVPGESDPAYADLERLRRRRPDRPFRLLAAPDAPTRAGGKPHDLAFALGRAAPESRIFILADADLRVGPDWARALAGALEDPAVGVATAMTPFVRCGSLSEALRMAWLAYGIPYLEWQGVPIGQTLALRRSDYEELAVGELWSRSLSEDMSLSRRLRGWPKRIEFVGAAVAAGIDGMEAQGLVTVCNRWTALFRIYRPDVWLLGALFTAFKMMVWIQALLRPGYWTAALLVCACDAAYVWLVLRTLAECPPGARGCGRPAWGALAAPLLAGLHAVDFACTLRVRRVRWGPRLYGVQGPQRISVLDPDEERAARRRRAARWAAAVLGGAALGLAHRPGCWGLLAWVAFVPLLWVISEAPPLRSFGWGACFGAAGYACGSPWLFGFVRRFLGVGGFEAACWFAGLCTVQGLRFALAAAAAAAVAPGWPRAALFVCAAVAAEGLVPMLVSGPLAMTQIFHPSAIQLLEPAGPAGLAALILVVNAALYALWRRPGAKAWAAVLAAAALVCVNEVWGARRLAAVEAAAAGRPSLRMGVVQGGRLPQPPPPPGRYIDDLPLYGDLTRSAAAAGASDLVIWPESSYAGVLDYDLAAVDRATIAGLPAAEVLRRQLGRGAPLLLSAIGRTPDGGERNLAVLCAPDRSIAGVYEKQTLVPFGEYMPWGRSLAWLRRVSPRTARLAPGSEPRLLSLGRVRLGVMICYEDLVPGPAALLAGLGAQVLVAQTNDWWFDGTIAPEQHLSLAVLRAVETRLPVVNAARTGVSALIAPSGRVTSRLESGRTGAAAFAVPLVEPRPGRSRRNGYEAAAILWAVGAGLAWARAKRGS